MSTAGWGKLTADFEDRINNIVGEFGDTTVLDKLSNSFDPPRPKKMHEREVGRRNLKLAYPRDQVSRYTPAAAPASQSTKVP